MTHRTIEGLIWARQAEAKPGFARVKRVRGAKALGIRYEKALARQIPGAQHGYWFEFQDKNGLGWCQPDFFSQIIGENCVLVLECKHTWTVEGHSQLERLYFPVLQRVFGLRPIGIQVCKHLTGGMSGIAIARSLDEAFNLASAGKRVAWHWLGGVPIRTPLRASPSVHLAGA